MNAQPLTYTQPSEVIIMNRIIEILWALLTLPVTLAEIFTEELVILVRLKRKGYTYKQARIIDDRFVSMEAYTAVKRYKERQAN